MSYFGTDGIRGRFGADPISPAFALQVGLAAGQVFGAGHTVVMGRDTRASGPVLEAALEAGLMAAGLDVVRLGVLPTPGIAHLGRALGAVASIVVSASHNPHHDNGIKFFAGDGRKLPDAQQEQINAALNLRQTVPTPVAQTLGHSRRMDEAASRYVEFCRSTFPYHLNLKGIKLVLDCANGAASQVAPQVFAELGAEVIALHASPDGVNINAGCGSTHPEALQAAVRAHGADAGLAFDGDSDRIVMVDARGALVDGDQILFVLASGREQKPAGVVGTVMSNMALELAFKDVGIGFARAKVGDRYVMEQLETTGWTLGGESSGHILCLDKSMAGDAIVAGLQVLAAMVGQGRPLHELTGALTLFPQHLVNVRLQQMADPYSHPELAHLFEKTSKELEGRGRILIRKSGTEPVIRVMVEGADAAEVRALAESLAAQVQQHLG